MAFWDDKDMLIDFVRYTFITCDETSICEMVVPPPRSRQPRFNTRSKVACSSRSGTESNSNVGPGSAVGDVSIGLDYESDEDCNEFSRPDSPDIQVEYTYRQRTNTSKRLDDLRAKKQITEGATTKQVHWKNLVLAEQKTDTNFDSLEFFKAREHPPEKQSPESDYKQSVVAKLIEDSPGPSLNAFADYAKFDASVNIFPAVKRLHIWPPRSPLSVASTSIAKDREIIVVTVDASARVCDTIGLTCCLFNTNNTDAQLEPTNVDHYSLFMAEESGEIDEDLPPLDANELIGKFGFPYLALVEVENPGGQSTVEAAMAEILDSPKNVFAVYFDYGDVHHISIPDTSQTTLKELRDLALTRRKDLGREPHPASRVVYEYNIERLDEPTKAMALDSLLRLAGTSKFYIVRANAKRSHAPRSSTGDSGTLGDNIILDDPEDFDIPRPKAQQHPATTPPRKLTVLINPPTAPESSLSDPHALSPSVVPLPIQPSCHFYTVIMGHKKLMSANEVQLVICTDRVEIIPHRRKQSTADRILSSVVQKPSGSSHGALVFTIDQIGGSEVTGNEGMHGKGRPTFRIIHCKKAQDKNRNSLTTSPSELTEAPRLTASTSPATKSSTLARHSGAVQHGNYNWRSHEFEAMDFTTAEEIVKRIRKYVDRAGTPARRAYVAREDGKSNKKLAKTSVLKRFSSSFDGRSPR